MTPAGFDAAALDRQYAFLDECPESLFDQVVTLNVGTLEERVPGVRTWRDALLDGTVPPVTGWPGEHIAAPARKALDDLGLTRFCKGQPDLVDEVMRDLLRAFDQTADAIREDTARRLRELEQLERARLQELAEEDAKSAKRKQAQRAEVDEDTLRRLRERAVRDAAAMDRGTAEGLHAVWGERARAWSELADVFGDLGEMLGRGWDLSIGVLRHTGWKDLVQLRELVAKLPQLREIVRTLGRLHDADDGESVAEKILFPISRLEEERREVRTPRVPAETRGIVRSGDISRMLPAEASMLGHDKLRLLWHARRAENALLTYRVEGIEVERVLVERVGTEEHDGKRPRPVRGPILAVLDTSGSMHGTPEFVAKALVLEAMRTAHAEGRRCFLYAYSGPGQVLEQELDLTPEGLGRLLSFLGFTFGGGNDETGVLLKVLGKLKAEAWRRADVVFASDGEWPTPRGVVGAVEEAKKAGTRFHGVQIGNVGQTGLHAICEPVHVFKDWQAAGGWR